MVSLLDALLIGAVPTSLQGQCRDKDGTWPDDLNIADDYPSDEAVEAISMVSVADAHRWMYDVFAYALRSIPYARVSVNDDGNERRIEVSTGGWSGVESVIYAALEHPIMRMYKLSERRGGHYVFLVPRRRCT